MKEHAGFEKIFFRTMVYGLLVLGAFIFCWPLVWMMSTSFKADRELFAEERTVLPQTPLPQDKSPYVDARYYEATHGPQMKELLPALETYLAQPQFAWPADLDRAETIQQTALGIYKRLLGRLSEETWKAPADTLIHSALAVVDKPMVDDVLAQIRRSVIIGEVRARSYDLQEDQLVLPQNAAKAWNIGGTAKGSLVQVEQNHQAGGELHYDFTGGDKLSLSQTFKTSFPIKRLYRLQLSFQSDDSWHPIQVYVEKEGALFKAKQITPIADYNWTLNTWQEPGPDDLTNKIRTWVQLEKVASGSQYEADSHKMKVIIEIGDVNGLSAWFYKIRRNYLKVFDNMPFWRYTATSVFLVVLNLVGTLLSCSIVAYSFARLRWPGKGLSFGLMMATMMVPQQVTMIPFFLIIRYLGWYNTLTPLWVGSFFTNAFFVFLLNQFFKGVPTDLEDAAKIDGCGALRIYWYIMMPLVKPSLAAIAILTFQGVWNDFMGPLIYLSDQRLYPLSLGLYALNVQAGTSMSLMMAGSLLMLLPVVVVFFFAQRYFIQGIAMTGMKG